MSVTENTAIKKKAKVEKPKAIKMITSRGESFIDCSKLPNNIQSEITQALNDVFGWHEIRSFASVYPARRLYTEQARIRKAFDDYGIDYTGATAPVRPLIELIDTFKVEIEAQMARKIQAGALEFDDIPLYFHKDCEVITTHSGKQIAGTVESVTLHTSFFGSYYSIRFKTISNVFGPVAEGMFETRLPGFAGVTKFEDLSVRKISDGEKELLTRRGEVFAKYATGAHYLFYKGQLARNSYWASRKFRADGRVMVDVDSFRQVDNNQFSQEGYTSGIKDDDRDDDSKASIEIPADQLWMTYPFLYGFSLAVKQWGRLDVDNLSEINFRMDAFDKLVLPEDDKELVRAIVEEDQGDFSDLIDGKGGGSIFLLHGPPGQGKTLTAEAIAEVLKRPLYSISVGELGTSPDDLESTLREILDVAMIWNAVLLLDEADIFLEERDEKDIVRNAMVGVFLRLLEYHQGVMFLTTNRVKNIDNAFYSRISIALRFGEGDDSKRLAIWTNLSQAAGVEGLDLKRLAALELNGRQIKNVIKTARKLSNYRNIALDTALIEKVIERTSNFKQEATEHDAGR
jgi:hypothetical protein